MYTNNAYLNNSTLDIKDKSKPLIVPVAGRIIYIPVRNFQPGVREAGRTFNYCILLPEKLIFILTEKNKLSQPAI